MWAKSTTSWSVDGQIYGGVAQGIGLALSEDFEDLKKHTSLAACGFPYIERHSGCTRNPLLREPAGARPVRCSRSWRTAADLLPRGCGQRHQKRHRGAHRPSAGPAGEGARRAEGPEQVIAGMQRKQPTQSGEPREGSRGSPQHFFWMRSMDQQELRALEHRCIQEEAPECTAACPIHVDGRAFVGHVAKGEWPKAWKVLRKTMPFPGILGRICDAPCRLRCKRGRPATPSRSAISNAPAWQPHLRIPAFRAAPQRPNRRSHRQRPERADRRLGLSAKRVFPFVFSSPVRDWATR
jgi:hypothetical protein